LLLSFEHKTARKSEKGETKMTNTQEHATWGELLHSAVHTPGKLHAAYTAFHNYSFGNALLALEQCISRKIEPGPLNSYKGWLQLKRQVRTRCQPLLHQKVVKAPQDSSRLPIGVSAGVLFLKEFLHADRQNALEPVG